MRETSEFSKEVMQTIVKTVESVLRIADKYQQNRDEFLQRFAHVLQIASTFATYENYQYGESGDDQ